MVALFYPALNPVLLDLGFFKIHWYGVSYAVGIFLAWRYSLFLIRRYQGAALSEKQLSDYIPWAIFGIILGGRLGISLFYYFDYYRHHLLEILYIWRPGMSFHGGLLGVLITAVWYCRRHRLSVLHMADLLATSAPIGLFFGRCANFINGELWGRPTTQPWGMIFPHVDQVPRHPSQLYEAFLEGLVLFTILYLTATRTPALKRLPGLSCGIFFVGYGCARILVECFREPDAHIGYWIGGTTLGQWLSLPLVIIGFWFIGHAVCSQRRAPNKSQKSSFFSLLSS